MGTMYPAQQRSEYEAAYYRAKWEASRADAGDKKPPEDVVIDAEYREVATLPSPPTQEQE